MRLVLALLLSLPVSAQAAIDCALPHDLGDRLLTLKTGHAERDDDLTLRNAFGPGGDSFTSDRFALWWGSNIDLSEAEATAFLDGFELAWQTEVGDWGLPDPTGIDGTYFNVYLGDTGPEVPSAEGAGGYYSVDEEDFPFIVLGLGVFDDPDWADTVVAHEFFHAVQGATGSFWDFDQSGWYWEATANWAAGRVHPENWSWAQALGYYAFSPHWSISTWENNGTAAPPSLHQYGAFIFPEYLTDYVDESAVRRSWAVGGEDPLLTLDGLIDVDLGVAFADHAAHNAGWDYPRGALFSSVVEGTAEFFEAWDHRIVDPNIDDDGWWTAPADLRPQRFASNTLELPLSAYDGFTYEFDGADVPWEHRLVEEVGLETRYTALLPGDEVGPLDAQVAWIVVSAVPLEWTGQERFDWRLRFGGEPEPEPTPEPTPRPFDPEGPDVPEEGIDNGLAGAGSGCSCSTGAASTGLLALLPLLLRRRTTSWRAGLPSRP
jgi:hypothetical protein